MSQRVPSRNARTSLLRNRVAVLGAGLGMSVTLGAGVASAAPAAAPVAAKPATKSAAKSSAKFSAKSAAKPAATSVAPGNVWVKPVKYYALSATFNQAGGMWAHKHSGQDFAVPSGTNVVAASGGTVVKAGGGGAGDGSAYGNAIVIKHANGLYSQYAHLSRVDVRIGQYVGAGQHIALSGNTGNSSGPHLHFEIRTTPNYGSAVNPVAFLRAKGVLV
ncbi:M23 family metallopeptidase [Streptomyces sp. NPDC059766]|uniref:M23 family metallopeptidase n=1 Tax=Streptomyces sp. NPDC059766 TaxID=3346940 RepID=UPI00364C4E2E